MRLVDQLIAYEEGQITGDEEIAFFERLVETGTCWPAAGPLPACGRDPHGGGAYKFAGAYRSRHF